MDSLERLAVAQACYKALGEIVSTKDPDSLRGHASAALLEQFRDDGTDRKRLRVNGKDVGKLIVVDPEPTEAEILDVYDTEKLFSDQDEDSLRAFAEAHAQEYASWARSQGLALKGVKTRTVASKKPAYTTIQGCKPEDVAEALGERLPEAFVGLLMGGDDGE